MRSRTLLTICLTSFLVLVAVWIVQYGLVGNKDISKSENMRDPVTSGQAKSVTVPSQPGQLGPNRNDPNPNPK